MTDLDPDLLAALRHLGARERHRPRPLCPQCGRHDQATTDGLCASCSHERRQLELDRKNRWWAQHGQAWRQERQDSADTTPCASPRKAPRR